MMLVAESKQEKILKIWEKVFLTRKIDEKMALLAKQNKGSAFFLSSAGHELVGAVCASTLIPGLDWAFPYYRDRAFMIGFGSDPYELLAAFMARDVENHSGGRMMPDHFSDRKKNVPCQSSCVGSQFLQAVGRALGLKFDKSQGIVYVSAGDGATSQGDFHEALNFASIHQLPVLFVIQDNGYAISTTRFEQTAQGNIAKIGKGHGLKVYEVDGTSVDACVKIFSEAVHGIRQGSGPVLIVCDVPRINSHTCVDDQSRYRSQEEIEKEKNRDPLDLLEKSVLSFVSQDEFLQIQKENSALIEDAVRKAEQIPFPKLADAATFIYKDFTLNPPPRKITSQKQPIVMIEAINHALIEEMKKNPYIIVFGEDVARTKGGVFGATRGLTEQFGQARCFNTPLAESTIIGVATGLAYDEKYHPVVEIPYIDFLWPGINQLVNELASVFYRSKGQWFCPVTLRIPCGGYVQGGPYHSQSLESVLAHIPGLKIAIPSNAEDAKKLLKSAIHDPNPTIFLEHKALYRKKGFCQRKEPHEDEFLEWGKAHVVTEGKDLTLVCWGYFVPIAHALAEKLTQENIFIEVIDLVTIAPLDFATICQSVKKTGKLLIVHEAAKTCGFGAEIAAKISEEAFWELDAPIVRVCGKDAPVPFCLNLETAILPQIHELEEAVRNLFAF